MAFRERFWSLFSEKLFDCVKVFVCGKLPCLWMFSLNKWIFFWWKPFLFMENFLVCGKFSWKRKFFFVENISVCGKFPWLWKISLTVKTFLYCRRVPWSSSVFLIVKNFVDQEKFLDWGKFTFYTAENLVGLIVFKRNATVGMTEIYFLILEQNVTLLTLFFVVHKINITFTWRLKHSTAWKVSKCGDFFSSYFPCSANINPLNQIYIQKL